MNDRQTTGYRTINRMARMGCAIIVAMALAGAASATNYYVSTTGSEANNGLTWGTALATITNALAKCQTSGDVITLAAGTYNQSGIGVSKSVTIQGAGATMTDTVVQAAAAPSTGNARLIQASASVTYSNLSLCNGGGSGSGGAVYDNGSGDQTFIKCLFAGNWISGGGGGAVYLNNAAAAKFTLSQCVFSNNCAYGANGGALNCQGGAITFDSCTFIGNVASNGGGAMGGAIYWRTGSGTIRNCTFYTNLCFGANNVYGGGAIGMDMVNGNASSTVTVDNCTFLANKSLYPSYASGTHYAGGGGAIQLYNIPGTLLARSCIFYANTNYYSSTHYGPDIYRNSGTLIVTNCLIGSTNGWDTSPNGPMNTVGTLTGCLIGQDPLLSLPANNGGPVPTCAIAANSPCLDKGANPQSLPYDQRGPGYPRVWNGTTDMGAFEWQPSWRFLYASTNAFVEWYAHNGTINNDTPLILSVAHDSFAGVSGQDYVANGWLVVSNLPANLTAVATQIDSNNLRVVLNGTAVNHSSAFNTNLVFVMTNDAAFLQGSAATVTNTSAQLLFRDAPANPVLTWTGSGFAEASANDGSIAASPYVTVTLANDHFAGTNGQNLATNGWVTSANLPTSLTAVVTRVSDFQATVTLAGNKVLPHNTSNNVSNLTFTFTSNVLFSARDSSIVTNATSPYSVSISFTNPVINYVSTTFTETTPQNDGGIGNSLTLTLAGDNLSGASNDDFVAAGKVVVSNVPPGLTAVIVRGSPTNLTASLTGKAYQHDFTNSIANLTFVFQGSAFANTPDGSVVTNYAKTNLLVNFITNAITYYVATNGSDSAAGTSWDTALKTVTNAHAKCRSAASDIIQLGAGVFTESNVVVSKSVVIKGLGVDQTVWQAATVPNSGAGRILSVSDDSAYSLRPRLLNMTLRYGSTNDNGGAFSFARMGEVLFANCNIVSNNTGPAAKDGGAAFIQDGNTFGSLLTFSNCTFLGSTASGNAGAVYVGSCKRTTFNGCLLRDNRALTASAGAVYGQGSASFLNCTLWGNAATNGYGGGFCINNGVDYMYNCTVVSNATKSGGGGVYASSGGGSLTIYNSINGSNTSSSGSTAYGGSYGTMSNCVVYGTCNGVTLQNCITAQDPKVLPLADNGGPTWTCALQAGSPCIGAATNALALPYDQRGYLRDSQPDIGAFESGAHGPMPPGSAIFFR